MTRFQIFGLLLGLSMAFEFRRWFMAMSLSTVSLTFLLLATVGVGFLIGILGEYLDKTWWQKLAQQNPRRFKPAKFFWYYVFVTAFGIFLIYSAVMVSPTPV
jgi:hypothetical protein